MTGFEIVYLVLFALVVGMTMRIPFRLRRAHLDEAANSTPIPGVLPKKGSSKEKTKDELLSSDEMVISREISLLDEEDVSQLETQPIPTLDDELESVVTALGSPKEALPEDFNLKAFIKKLRSRMLTPLDYNFPSQMTIVDQIQRKTVIVSLVELRSPEEAVDLSGESGLIDVLNWTPHLRSCDCFLFVRPFVRVLGPKEEWVIDHLRSMRGTVEIDGYAIADDVPIDSWILNLEGRGLTSLPYKFVPKNSHSYWGHTYETDKAKAESAFWRRVRGYNPREQPEIGGDLGPIVTNGSEVIIKLKRMTNPGIRIVIGCVGALYSTAPP